MVRDYVSDNNGGSYIAREKFNNDLCFPGNATKGFDITCVEDDPFYHKPDYSFHVFSTMGSGLYTINRNNMIIPIRENYSFLNVGNVLESKVNNFRSVTGRGIYVVETFNFYDDNSMDIDTLINYYSNHPDIRSITHEVKQVFADHLKAYKTEKPDDRLSIRVISFIDEESIRRNSYTYMPNVDLGIMFGKHLLEAPHPRSEFVKYIKNTKIEEDGLVIKINLIDNLNRHCNKYIKVGDKVNKITSRPDAGKTRNLSIQTYNDGVLVNEIEETDLDKLKDYGIYDSVDLCIQHGDLENQLKLDKISLDKEKLSLEVEKMSHERVKMIIDAYKVKLDLSKHFNAIIVETIKTANVLATNALKENREVSGIANDKLKKKIDLEHTKKKNQEELDQKRKGAVFTAVNDFVKAVK